MTTVKFVEWRTLQCRGAVDPAPDEAVDGTLLVAEKSALHFYANQSSYGEDSVSIFPAFHNGKRCWVRREVWCPSYGNSAEGTSEWIVGFEAGCKILVEHGVFTFEEANRVRPEVECKPKTTMDDRNETALLWQSQIAERCIVERGYLAKATIALVESRRGDIPADKMYQWFLRSVFGYVSTGVSSDPDPLIDRFVQDARIFIRAVEDRTEMPHFWAKSSYIRVVENALEMALSEEVS